MYKRMLSERGDPIMGATIQSSSIASVALLKACSYVRRLIYIFSGIPQEYCSTQPHQS